MPDAKLTINSRNYGAWSLRGWMLCKLVDLDVDVDVLPSDDASSRAELMLLAPSFLVPRLTHGDVVIWDTLAIAEYLNEIRPDAGLLPTDTTARARCRSISGEMHSGFVNLRSSLPMNVKARHADFPLWSGAQADIDRVSAIWQDSLGNYGGPYLFGATPTMADAMYAPVCSPRPHLRREARGRLPRLPRHHPEHGTHAGVDRAGGVGARRDRGARRRVLRAKEANRGIPDSAERPMV